MFALSILFLVTALLSFEVIFGTLRDYGSRAIALRDELADCPQTRELRYVVREMKLPPRPTARVLVLPVRRAAPRLPQGLRAAA
jgi:hypothetical protein